MGAPRRVGRWAIPSHSLLLAHMPWTGGPRPSDSEPSNNATQFCVLRQRVLYCGFSEDNRPLDHLERLNQRYFERLEMTRPRTQH